MDKIKHVIFNLSLNFQNSFTNKDPQLNRNRDNKGCSTKKVEQMFKEKQIFDFSKKMITLNPRSLKDTGPSGRNV